MKYKVGLAVNGKERERGKVRFHYIYVLSNSASLMNVGTYMEGVRAILQDLRGNTGIQVVLQCTFSHTAMTTHLGMQIIN